jgi:hypothetical protein
LLATAPNQLWSWDITKLRGPAKWTYFYLYVILDVFRRYVVGWMVALRESAALASKLIEETCEKQIILPDQLTVHADRGSSMRSKPVAFLLADLSITKTHSRPYTSNDNPFSESQFRTMKYRPEFLDRFGCIQDGRAFCHTFFPWYNDDHRHSGIGMMTPAIVHYGLEPRPCAKTGSWSTTPLDWNGRCPRGQRGLKLLILVLGCLPGFSLLLLSTRGLSACCWRVGEYGGAAASISEGPGLRKPRSFCADLGNRDSITYRCIV